MSDSSQSKSVCVQNMCTCISNSHCRPTRRSMSLILFCLGENTVHTLICACLLTYVFMQSHTTCVCVRVCLRECPQHLLSAPL